MSKVTVYQIDGRGSLPKAEVEPWGTRERSPLSGFVEILKTPPSMSTLRAVDSLGFTTFDSTLHSG